MAAERQPDERYRLRYSYFFRFLLATLLGHRRDLAPDINAILERFRPPPRVIDDQHIPPEGPFVLVTNHYERPGLRVYWGGMAITAAVYGRRRSGRSLHWLMTSEWYNFRLAGLIPVPVWFLRLLFRRIARVYGLVIVPRSPQRVAGRATAMRAIMEVLDRQREPIALYPEGTGGEALIEALPGTGLFLYSITRRGIPILPAAVFETDGVLTIRFGPPFAIQLPQGVDKRQRDRLARDQVMSHIGRLLPEHMRGPYTLAVEQLLERSGRMA